MFLQPDYRWNPQTISKYEKYVFLLCGNFHLSHALVRKWGQSKKKKKHNKIGCLHRDASCFHVLKVFFAYSNGLVVLLLIPRWKWLAEKGLFFSTCPNQGSNQQRFALWDNAQATEPHGPGQIWDILSASKMSFYTRNWSLPLGSKFARRTRTGRKWTFHCILLSSFVIFHSLWITHSKI